MLQIQTAIPAANPLPGAAAEVERSPGDGFEALLAGLMGIALQPALPPQPGRAPAGGPLATPAPEAVPTDADAAGGGKAGADPEGAAAPLLRPAATPLEPGAATAPASTPAAAPAAAELSASADGAPTLPRAPAAPVPGGAQEAARSRTDRPADTASTELPRQPAERPSGAGVPGSPSASAEGRAAAAELPRLLPERPGPRARAEAGKPAATEAVPSAQPAEARAEAASRPLLEALARGTDRAGPHGPIVHGPLAHGPARQGPGPHGPAAPGSLAQGPVAQGPVAQGLLAQGSVAPGALPFGPILAGGGFAQLTLHAEWQEPLDLEAGRIATSLPGGPQRLDAIAAEAAAGRTAATPPAQQLAAAIERAVGGDVQRLTVQLSPEALGSIEIALEVDAERRLSVVIMAERPETVELLRTEARDLQRLLAQQGIDLGDAGLELGLMGDERRERQPSGDEDTPGEAERETGEVQALPAALPGAAAPEHDPVGRTGRLNLSI